jgi:hypothetical protein
MESNALTMSSDKVPPLELILVDLDILKRYPILVNGEIYATIGNQLHDKLLCNISYDFFAHSVPLLSSIPYFWLLF